MAFLPWFASARFEILTEELRKTTVYYLCLLFVQVYQKVSILIQINVIDLIFVQLRTLMTLIKNFPKNGNNVYNKIMLLYYNYFLDRDKMLKNIKELLSCIIIFQVNYKFLFFFFNFNFLFLFYFFNFNFIFFFNFFINSVTLNFSINIVYTRYIFIRYVII